MKLPKAPEAVMALRPGIRWNAIQHIVNSALYAQGFARSDTVTSLNYVQVRKDKKTSKWSLKIGIPGTSEKMDNEALDAAYEAVVTHDVTALAEVRNLANKGLFYLLNPTVVSALER